MPCFYFLLLFFAHARRNEWNACNCSPKLPYRMPCYYLLRTPAVTNGMLAIVHQTCRTECHDIICCARPPSRMERFQLSTRTAATNAWLKTAIQFVQGLKGCFFIFDDAMFACSCNYFWSLPILVYNACHSGRNVV